MRSQFLKLTKKEVNMHRIWHEEQKMQKFKPTIGNELPYIWSLLLLRLQSFTELVLLQLQNSHVASPQKGNFRNITNVHSGEGK